VTSSDGEIQDITHSLQRIWVTRKKNSSGNRCLYLAPWAFTSLIGCMKWKIDCTFSNEDLEVLNQKGQKLTVYVNAGIAEGSHGTSWALR